MRVCVHVCFCVVCMFVCVCVNVGKNLLLVRAFSGLRVLVRVCVYVCVYVCLCECC